MAYQFNGATPTSGKPNRITTMPASAFSQGISVSLWAIADNDLPDAANLVGSGQNGDRWFGFRSDKCTCVPYPNLVTEATTSSGYASMPSPGNDVDRQYVRHEYNQWIHLVAMNAGGNYKVYTNGMLAFSRAVGSPTSIKTGNLVIGDFEDAVSGSCWKGKIDDVRFYNRSLTDTEVQSIYQVERIQTPCAPRRATAVAQVVNGFVVGATVTDSGCGYTNSPAVLVVGGGGSGATAQATVSNGRVTGITILTTGSGYTSVPEIRIASPPFIPKLYVETSRVRVNMDLVLARRYQLQSSSNLTTWANLGASFVADSERLTQEFDTSVTGRYFRIQEVP
jgi:hypothetical protein